MSTSAPPPGPPEEGYTKFPNPLLEGIARAGFNGTQAAVALVVMRRTYGWHVGAAGAPISLREFMQDTGLAEQTVRDAIRVLRKEGVLIVVNPHTPNSAASYRLRKDTRDWGKFACETDALRAVLNRPREGTDQQQPPPPPPPGRGGSRGTNSRTSRTGTNSRTPPDSRTSRPTETRTPRGTETRTSRGTGFRGGERAQRQQPQQVPLPQRKGNNGKDRKETPSVAKATGADAPAAEQQQGGGEKAEERPMRYRDYMNGAAAIVRDTLWINGEPPRAEGFEGWDMKNELSIWRQLAERFGAAAVNRGLRSAREVLGIPADQPVTLAIFNVNGRMDRMQRCIGELDRRARRESMRDTSRVLESLGSVLSTARARAAEGGADAAAA